MRFAREIVGFVRPYRGGIFLWFVVILLGSVANLAPAQLVWKLLDAHDARTLTRWGLLLVIVLGLQAVLNVLSEYVGQSVGERMVADLRDRLFDRLVRASLRVHGERSVGELLGRMGDAGELSSIVRNVLVMCRHVLVTGGALTLMFLISVELTLVLLSATPIVVGLAMSSGRVSRKRSIEVAEKSAAATSVLVESLTNIRTVQSFCNENHELTRYRSRVAAMLRSLKRRAIESEGFTTVVRFVVYLTVGIVVWRGRTAILGTRLTAGQLSALLVYAFIVVLELVGMLDQFKGMKHAQGLLERVFALLEVVRDLPEPEKPTPIPRERRFDVEVDHVSFAYRDGDAPVLDDISFKATRGDVIAIVGPSGAGKSSLVNLIPRFFDVTSGTLRIGGVDVRQLALREIRDQVGIVPQELAMFSGTVRDNIAYGRLSASHEDIVKAAKAAHANTFIEKLPKGYDTVLGDGGMALSVGQRQRIAIARTVLKDPAILMLDEATSSLDVESEAVVQAALNRLMRGRTTFIVAHRLATIQKATKILVLDAGRIVAVGKHDELAITEGLYSDLYHKSMRDHATGVWSEQYVRAEIAKLTTTAARYKRNFSVLSIGLAVLSGQAVTLGVGPGLEFLRFVAKKIEGELRACDVLGVLGTSEFLALLPETDAEQALVPVQRMCATLLESSSSDLRGSLHIGIASFPASGPDVASASNGALVEARRLGKAYVVASKPAADSDKEAGIDRESGDLPLSP